ncbi:MAG: alanine--tRNA ligase [bacterium]
MDSFQIRKKFLEYFEKHGHTIVPSSSLIPAQDPTLLFANAGMNQFKDCFLGKEKRSYSRATSSQKCVRAGGKHNDLDQVGFTKRHLTFFEMLGNFSFGDYFKTEAIEYAWEFLTKDMQLDPNKLYASVFKDDQEAYNLWLTNIGLPKERIIKLGEKDNFWAMGDTGPCGPCTEIYVDQGEELGCKQKNCAPGCDCDRFIEIWNLVFMQYNRQSDGKLEPLKQTGVDTGMGLERLCVIMQGKKSIFNTDIFQAMISEMEHLTGVNYAKSTQKIQASFHVLADHIRSSSLLIADGCSPSNEGRGYVLRKIIRRAALFAQNLSDDQKFFSKLAEKFIEYMSPVFTELTTNRKLILTLLDSEVEKFATNLIQGQGILEKYIKENVKAGQKEISGIQVFKLYDTYGFPPELTELMAKEQNFSIDMKGFDTEMEKQKQQSGKKMKDDQEACDLTATALQSMTTTFVGEHSLEHESLIQFISPEQNFAWISTQESPFYVESGGQISDKGWVIINNQTFPVLELKKIGDPFKPAIAVKIELKTIDGQPAQDFIVGTIAKSVVDQDTRAAIVKNHTATHMLQAALVQILGPQIKQAGSLVTNTYLRFDFTHHKALSKDEIKDIEHIVNQKIQQNIALNVEHKTLKAAQEAGAKSFFGEKYNPEDVRVVQIPGFSAELCGGTHTHNTGEIGLFKIVSESALASGTRRIFAVTGLEAEKLFQQSFETVKTLGDLFKVKPEEVVDAVNKQQENLHAALSALKQLKKQLYKMQIPVWEQQIQTISKIPFLFLELEDASNDDMRDICQQLATKKPGFYFIISKPTKDADRFSFLGFSSKDIIDLKTFAQFLKETFDLKGGGSSTMIQGGGTTLPKDLKEKITQYLQNK